jgi:hypothetical protein
MKIKVIIILIGLGFLQTLKNYGKGSFAQEGQTNAPPPSIQSNSPLDCKEAAGKTQVGYRCGQCEQSLINEVNDTISKIQNNPEKFSSIDKVLENFPLAMRETVVFMGLSQSLQEGDRYLMKSPSSEVVASFNGHPELRGGNSVELMTFNGKDGTWELIEISVENGQAKVDTNPSKCIKCHGSGGDTRPIFDPYRFWSNQVPSAGDKVAGGTHEEKDFISFLEKIENKKNNPEWQRFAHLKPFLENNPLEIVRESMAATSKASRGYRVKNKHHPSDGPAAALFDELYLKNHCRINRLFEENPNFETFKYALAAIVKRNCINTSGDMDKYIPEKFKKTAAEYFDIRGIADKDNEDAFKEVLRDTKTKQNEYFADRVGRKMWIMEEKYRETGLSEEEAYNNAVADLIKITESAQVPKDQERSAHLIAPLRYLLEPFGFDTSTLSISVDPGSFTFGDFIFNMSIFEPMSSLTKLSCEELQERSLAAFESNNDQYLSELDSHCQKLKDYDLALEDLVDAAEEAEEIILAQERAKIRPQIEALLDDNKCMDCHGIGSKSGAPNLPFSSEKISEFEEMLSRSTGELGDMRHRIWSRVNRPSHYHGVMPPSLPLSIEEKIQLKQYFETFTKKNRDSKPRISSGGLLEIKSGNNEDVSRGAEFFINEDQSPTPEKSGK